MKGHIVLIHKKINKKGFTLIEALIVVVVLGSLTSISLSVIDSKSQKDKVRDTVKVRNLEAVVEAIESYRQLEGEYPSNSSINNTSSLLYQVYLDEWPGSEYKYNNSGDDTSILVSDSMGGCYRYQFDWAQVLQCSASECDVSQNATASSCVDLLTGKQLTRTTPKTSKSSSSTTPKTSSPPSNNTSKSSSSSSSSTSSKSRSSRSNSRYNRPSSSRSRYNRSSFYRSIQSWYTRVSNYFRSWGR